MLGVSGLLLPALAFGLGGEMSLSLQPVQWVGQTWLSKGT